MAKYEKTDYDKIERFQEHLSYVCAIAGLTREELADLIDVSRITLINICNLRSKMTMVQYLAIRKTIDDKAVVENNTTLQWFLNVCIDYPNIVLTDYKKSELISLINGVIKKTGTRSGKQRQTEQVILEIENWIDNEPSSTFYYSLGGIK